MSTSRGVAGTAGSGPSRRSFARIRRSTVAALGLLVVIGASAVGLHDVADSQLVVSESSAHA